jgi:hypothetical protein
VGGARISHTRVSASFRTKWSAKTYHPGCIYRTRFQCIKQTLQLNCNFARVIDGAKKLAEINEETSGFEITCVRFSSQLQEKGFRPIDKPLLPVDGCRDLLENTS